MADRIAIVSFYGSGLVLLFFCLLNWSGGTLTQSFKMLISSQFGNEHMEWIDLWVPFALLGLIIVAAIYFSRAK